MSSEETSDQVQDRVAVRIFTLCDHAAVPPDGKIYINGAGVHQLYLPQIPGPILRLYLVVRLSIPWHMLGEPHSVRIRALDLDRKPVGSADPLIEMPFELGRPPGHRPGDESAINICAELSGVTVPEPMTLRFHLLVDEEPIDSLPLKVGHLPAQGAAPAR